MVNYSEYNTDLVGRQLPLTLHPLSCTRPSLLSMKQALVPSTWTLRKWMVIGGRRGVHRRPRVHGSEECGRL